MFRIIRFTTIFLIILVALGAALYTQRVTILDWYRELTEPTLPEAVTYEDIEWTFVGTEVVEETNDEWVPEEEAAPPVVETETDLEDPQETVDLPVTDVPSDSEGQETDEPSVLPDSINLAVPFTSQAPHANWDYPYKETCEEASVYMVERYYAGEPEGVIPAKTADEDILSIVAFEKELFGYYEDTTAEQTGVFAELMFGFSSVKLMEDPSVDQIKEQLVAGHPVLVPVAGRLLGNPNFTAPGPIYHMLVIRGYTQDSKFITNDPGTRNGEAYLYDFNTVMNAMHDWNNTEEITEGRKVVIVIYP